MTNQDNFVYSHLSGVQSSAISLVAFNEHTNRLFIRFTGGSEISYDGVPKAEYDALVNASSVGQYYSYNVKGEYVGVKQNNTRLRKSEAKSAPKAKVVTGPAPAVVTGPTTTIKVSGKKATRFSVAWAGTDGRVGGNPEFQATDENDALVQFQAAVVSAAKAGFAPAKGNVTVRSVTRYFD